MWLSNYFYLTAKTLSQTMKCAAAYFPVDYLLGRVYEYYPIVPRGAYLALNHSVQVFTSLIHGAVLVQCLSAGVPQPYTQRCTGPVSQCRCSPALYTVHILVQTRLYARFAISSHIFLLVKDIYLRIDQALVSPSFTGFGKLMSITCISYAQFKLVREMKHVFLHSL